MSYICNVLYLKCPISEMSYLWNVLSLKCPIYEMSYLWNVQYLKCPISEMSYLWNVLSLKCTLYEMSYLINNPQLCSLPNNTFSSLLEVLLLSSIGLPFVSMPACGTYSESNTLNRFAFTAVIYNLYWKLCIISSEYRQFFLIEYE